MNELDWGQILSGSVGSLVAAVFLFLILLVLVMWIVFPIVTYYQLKRIGDLSELTAIRLKNINERVARLEIATQTDPEK